MKYQSTSEVYNLPTHKYSPLQLKLTKFNLLTHRSRQLCTSQYSQVMIQWENNYYLQYLK